MTCAMDRRKGGRPERAAGPGRQESTDGETDLWLGAAPRAEVMAEVVRSGAEGQDQQPERPQVRELLASFVGGERHRRDAGA